MSEAGGVPSERSHALVDYDMLSRSLRSVAEVLPGRRRCSSSTATLSFTGYQGAHSSPAP